MPVLLALVGSACAGVSAGPPQTLGIAASYELASLDPHRQDTLAASALLSNIYEPLVATDADMKLVPRLAETWENPDPRTWIFHLRRGVAFHDGRLFSARDAVASIQRLQREAGLEMRKKVRGIEEAVALDAWTLRLRTREPDRTLLHKLSGVLLLPARMPPEAGAANGTGPYRLLAWDGAKRFQLVRHERHWAGAGVGAFRRVDYALGLDPAAALAALRDGRVQIAETGGLRLSDEDARGFRVARRDSLYTKLLFFDLARERTPGVPGRRNPFLDPQVRRALHVAIDRSALASLHVREAAPATQLVPRFVFGFDSSLPEPRPDPAAARELLRAAGLAGGFRAKLLTRHVLAELAAPLPEMLATIGVALEVEAVSDAEFFERLRRGEASLWLDRVACISGDAGELFADFLHSRDEKRRLGSANDSGLRDRGLDRAIEASAELEDDLDRRAALSALMARLMRELPVLPLVTAREVYVFDRRLAFAARFDGEIRASEVTASD